MPSTTIPAPSGGWNSFDPIVGLDPKFAPVFENLIVDQAGVKVRRGYREWATGMPGRVDGLLQYRSGGQQTLFAVSGDSIYDVTSPGMVGAPVVSGLSSAVMNGIMVDAAGGDFLLAFNGADPAYIFDGVNWSVWRPTGVLATISWAGLFKGRLLVGFEDKLAFWYGLPGAYTGPFLEFPLQGIVHRGGGVISMALQTHDTGFGVDARLVLLTSEGEAISYAGTDPNTAATFSLIGVYAMARPIPSGMRSVAEIGGDVAFVTEAGVLLLARIAAVTSDAAEASATAITRAITPDYLAAVEQRKTFQGWQFLSLTSDGVWIVNLPWNATDAQQYAAKAQTQAYSRWTGLPAAVWIEFEGRGYFGHAGKGSVCLWGQDTSDSGAQIAAECVQAFMDFGAPGALKKFGMLQPLLLNSAGAAVRVDLPIDWSVPVPERIAAGPSAPPPPLSSVLPIGSALVWGEGKWDVNTWGMSVFATAGAGASVVSRFWRSVAGIALVGAVRLRILSRDTTPVWIGTTFLYQPGGPLR